MAYRYVENAFYNLFNITGEIVFLFLKTLGELKTVLKSRGRILNQMLEIGFNTLPLAAMIGLFTGMVLALQTGIELRRFGYEQIVGAIVGLSMVREMGPVITAFLVSARVGSAMAAEIGTMAVTEEVDALKAMGINPVRYLVLPRFIGAFTMLPLLTIYSVIVGIIGGEIVSTTFLNISSEIYLRNLWDSMAFKEIWHGLSKTFVFATIISIVSCYMGLTTTNGAEGVGKATTRSVVISLTLILVSDFFISRFIG